MMEWGWNYQDSVDPVPARTIAERLRQSLRALEEYGVRIPSTGRHQAALRLLDAWNSSDEQLDMSDRDTMLRIEAANRTAWETYEITVAADHRRRRRKSEDLFTIEKFNTMMGGREVDAGENSVARATQFELFLGAEFVLGGLEVRGGEPDLRFRYGSELVGVAAKRVTSFASKQLKRHVDKAVEQIENSKMRGWIALNLDRRFSGIGIDLATEDLLREFGETFDTINSYIDRHSSNSNVLGVLAYGHVVGWAPRETQAAPPGLVTLSPIRWMRITDDPAGKMFFKDFSGGFSSRLKRRREVLRSSNFQGVL